MNRRRKEYFQWVEEMNLIVTLFPYPSMVHMKIWDETKVYLSVVVPKNPTVDLTATPNSELFLVDTNDEKYQN